MRTAILGNSGSGKSTLARALAAEHARAVLDLDTIAWESAAPPTRRPLEQAAADVRAFCAAHDAWIVEGCYADLIEVCLEAGPELVFLDPGLERCRANCRARPFEPHKYATREEQDANLPSLLAWVAEYYTRDGDLSHARHLELYERYRGPKRRVTD